MKLIDVVYETMREYPATKENDNLLYHYCLEKMYGTSNVLDIAYKTKKNVFESISRARRKIQEFNPMMKSSPAVQMARAEKEKEVREWARKTI